MDDQASKDSESVQPQIGENRQAGSANDFGDQSKNTDGCQTNNKMGQLHHDFESRLKKITQVLLVRIGQADDGKSEKKTKDDQGQDLPLGHGLEYIIRHQVQQQPLKGGFGTVAELGYGMGQLFRRGLQRQLCSFAWTYDIDQYQASDNGQQAGAQVVGKGLSTQASKMTDSAYADHPGNNGGDDQGDDDHF